MKSTVETTETRQIDLLEDQIENKPLSSWFSEMRISNENTRKSSKEILYWVKNPKQIIENAQELIKELDTVR